MSRVCWCLRRSEEDVTSLVAGVTVASYLRRILGTRTWVFCKSKICPLPFYKYIIYFNFMFIGVMAACMSV